MNDRQHTRPSMGRHTDTALVLQGFYNRRYTWTIQVKRTGRRSSRHEDCEMEMDMEMDMEMEMEMEMENQVFSTDAVHSLDKSYNQPTWDTIAIVWNYRNPDDQITPEQARQTCARAEAKIFMRFPELAQSLGQLPEDTQEIIDMKLRGHHHAYREMCKRSKGRPNATPPWTCIHRYNKGED